MSDLIVVAYFADQGSPELISADMWLDKRIPSTVEQISLVGKDLWTIAVAMPDYETAKAYVSLWEKLTWNYFFSDEVERKRDEFRGENPFLPSDIDADIDSFMQGETIAIFNDNPRDLALRVAEHVHNVLGDEAAKNLVDTFEQFTNHRNSIKPVVSIIILMHEKWQHTKRCLWSLFETKDVPFELILVDNGSTDELVKNGLTIFLNECLVREIPARLITYTINVGAVKGRNEALPYASGDYILFMDNDVVVRQRSWLRKMVEFLDANKNYGAVGPKLIYPNEPHLIQCAGCDVSPKGRVNFRGRGEPINSREFNTSRDVQCLISACILFPRRVVERVGKLDMAFDPVQFEDIDYCYRIKKAGYKLRYLSQVEMYHFENVTTAGTSKLNYPYLTVKNGEVFKKKWKSMFSKEDGPPDESMIWRDIPSVDINSIHDLAIFD